MFSLKKLFRRGPRVAFGPTKQWNGHDHECDVFVDGAKVGTLWRDVGYIPPEWHASVELWDAFNVPNFQ